MLEAQPPEQRHLLVATKPHVTPPTHPATPASSSTAGTFRVVGGAADGKSCLGAAPLEGGAEDLVQEGRVQRTAARRNADEAAFSRWPSALARKV